MGYDFVHEAQARARTAPVVPGSLASLRTPLLFDPGDDWAYGVNTDWAGLAVEAVSGQRLDAYVANHITGPLTMPDTMFGLDAAHKARLATLMLRGEDGALSPFPMNIGGGTEAEFIAGGAGLCGTAGDYMRFLRMILNGGSLEGTTILSHASIAEMTRNQIGGLRAGAMATTMPALSRAVDWFPEMTPGWGLGFLINPETSVDGRPAGSLAWAGIANTYFWIDPGTGLAGVLLMQLLPFADPGALGVLSAFERGVYK
jgi:CubicO group peptidase (beta-lactamase class C family)